MDAVESLQGKKSLEGNVLLSLLSLSEREKDARGLKHTPHEIFQQPETWKSTFRQILEGAPSLKAFLENAGIGSPKRPKPVVFLAGAGTSDYIGRALTHLLRSRWQCEVWAVPSTDLLTGMENMITSGRDYLWITFSRSGESPEGVAVLEKALAHHPEIFHLVITCNDEGKMARICASHTANALPLILNSAVNDRGLAMTSSFTNMLIAGQCLAHVGELPQFERLVEVVSEAGARFLESAGNCAAHIAESACTKACFIGTGPLSAVANESALKVLELTAGKIPTLSESVLGLRHGPMSSLDKDALLVLFLSSDHTRRRYELDLLKEVREKNLGKTTVVVTSQAVAGLHALADHVLSLDTELPDEYRPPLDVMFGQLLGLFLSLRAGLQPDRPSPNGAISRVVSHFNIY